MNIPLARAIVHLADFSGRDSLGTFLESRQVENGVEVGTHRGGFAEILLSRWSGRLTCVDPWSVPPGYESQVRTLWGGGDREADFQAARERLSPYRDRVTFIRDVSESVVDRFTDSSVGFVYLDGDHRREKVEQDVRLWWPKVAPDGLLCGHDIICPGEVGHTWADEIQPAVFEFAVGEGVGVYLIQELQCLPWSFYIIKERLYE